MKKNSKTSTIGDLLNNSIFGKKNIQDRMQTAIKHSTIFSYWTSVVGAKFARYTKPSAIKYNKLYVSAKSSTIIQELNLYKVKLIKKINSYSLPLGIEIKDIIFNYKNFSMTNPNEKLENQVEDKPVFFSKEKVQEIEISKEQETGFKKVVDKINFLNQEQKDELLDKLLNAKKAKTLQDKADI